ncbi:MAG: hypothetical protein C0184_12245 [Chloroflexus aggregans]|uniref:Uncharacterized protein n=1 Tax=Chloroflexus aggregans TaxID=152260 RepID=A0A2J6X066_9CHLR|nr:MAG: hypothetical protein C0184_12245 [Chloroflexus aggregans]
MFYFILVRYRKLLFGILQIVFSVIIVPFMIFILAAWPIDYSLSFHLPIDVLSSGISSVEIGEKGEFRWFATESEIAFPLLSRADHRLVLEIHGGGTNSRTLKIRWNGERYTSTVLRAGWNRLILHIPSSIIREGENVLSFSILPLPTLPQEKNLVWRLPNYRCSNVKHG